MTGLTAWTDCCFMPGKGLRGVEAFISRLVMDSWIDPREPDRGRRSLLRAQYNALGKFNLATIARIVVSKYRRGAAFNRQHPFVDIVLSDIWKAERRSIRANWCANRRLPLFNGLSRRRHTLTLRLNAEYARQSSWYRPSVTLGEAAESWFRLVIKAEQIQALTDHARAIIRQNPNLDVR
jgi:hypothetical protein